MKQSRRYQIQKRKRGGHAALCDEARAVLGAALRLLEQARVHEKAALRGGGPETIHQFRVCLRKSRSALSLGACLLPPKPLREWKTKLADVCRRTNHLRDLDVHLAELQGSKKILPQPLHAGLGVFKREVKTARDTEAAAVMAVFSSPEHDKQMSAVLASLANAAATNSRDRRPAEVAQSVAAAFIGRRFQKIILRVESLAPNTSEAELHKIRIDCKKLRYALDIFGGILNPKPVKALTKDLARLQKILGRLNDNSVQQRFLFEARWLKTAASDSRLSMCLGGLATHLHTKHQGLRAAAIEALRDFRSGRAKIHISRILKTATPPATA